MNNVKKISGVSLASIAATLLLTGATTSVSADEKKVAEVKCSGINSCKGKSGCATATSACAGQNSRKGKGWIKVRKTECDTKDGKVVTSSM